MRRDSLTVAGLLLGIALIAVAGYYGSVNDLDRYGQPHYAITQVSEVSAAEVPADADVLSYEALPRRAQGAFDAAREGDSILLWEVSDREAVELLSDHRYLSQQGVIYEYLLLSGHRGSWGEALATTLGIGLAGVGLVGFGGWQWMRAAGSDG